MIGKIAKNDQTIVITSSDTREVFLFSTIAESRFHLISENFSNKGYNHFELYVDQKTVYCTFMMILVGVQAEQAQLT